MANKPPSPPTAAPQAPVIASKVKRRASFDASGSKPYSQRTGFSVSAQPNQKPTPSAAKAETTEPAELSDESDVPASTGMLAKAADEVAIKRKQQAEAAAATATASKPKNGREESDSASVSSVESHESSSAGSVYGCSADDSSDDHRAEVSSVSSVDDEALPSVMSKLDDAEKASGLNGHRASASSASIDSSFSSTPTVTAGASPNASNQSSPTASPRQTSGQLKPQNSTVQYTSASSTAGYSAGATTSGGIVVPAYPYNVSMPYMPGSTVSHAYHYNNSRDGSPSSSDAGSHNASRETSSNGQPGGPQTPLNDDSEIQTRLPSICVDYLSHQWDETDVWASWKAMTKHKNEIVNGVRLENASWRTWAKQRNKLKTISPETLNWLKDSDVTWLYGPLHTGVDPVPPPKAATLGDRLGLESTAASSLSSDGSDNTEKAPLSVRGASTARAKKPILKYRSLSDILNLPSSPGPVLGSSATDGDYLTRGAASTDAPAGPGVPYAANLRKTAVAGASILSPATSTAIRFSSPEVSDDGESTPHAGGSQSSRRNSKDSKPKKHISFNHRVEQCIAVDQQDDQDPHYRRQQRLSNLHHRFIDEEEEAEGDEDDEDDDEDDVLTFKSSPRSATFAPLQTLEHHTIAKLAPTTLKSSEELPAPSPIVIYSTDEEHSSPEPDSATDLVGTSKRTQASYIATTRPTAQDSATQSTDVETEETVASPSLGNSVVGDGYGVGEVSNDSSLPVRTSSSSSLSSQGSRRRSRGSAGNSPSSSGANSPYNAGSRENLDSYSRSPSGSGTPTPVSNSPSQSPPNVNTLLSRGRSTSRGSSASLDRSASIDRRSAASPVSYSPSDLSGSRPIEIPRGRTPRSRQSSSEAGTSLGSYSDADTLRASSSPRSPGSGSSSGSFGGRSPRSETANAKKGPSSSVSTIIPAPIAIAKPTISRGFRPPSEVGSDDDDDDRYLFDSPAIPSSPSIQAADRNSSFSKLSFLRWADEPSGAKTSAARRALLRTAAGRLIGANPDGTTTVAQLDDGVSSVTYGADLSAARTDDYGFGYDEYDDDQSSVFGRTVEIATTARDLVGALWNVGSSVIWRRGETAPQDGNEQEHR
ncbi:hypothetical protein E5Q_05959 [Mixia osmundae IAM 14324]|uniref:Nitrogen regulatory protein areA GATA-like domain-containing protein n=2 Tax=Mixia osmundae (strain CBS 9802 / IAM 14324 / JCM 22182 / KY 12970) TaxID=764103 RepID=G7E9E6_MIXOS|nr:hypothetical protein E5Q_05959 [Mixia osmundae IAM 14324]